MAGEARGKFSGKMAFILAASASAVGLGDLWRFPSEAYQNGGGAFLICYIVITLTIGVIMMITEMAIGRKTGLTGSAAFAEINKKWGFLGVLTALAPTLIGAYYCTIGGWVLYYLYEYLVGSGAILLGDMFFETFRACGLEGILNNPFTWFLIFTALTAFINYKGVDKGIEKSSIILIPALILLLIGITAVAMANGAADYVGMYVNFKLEDFTPGMMTSALSQAFYSLSLSFGLLITYGSYMKKNVDMEKSTVAVILIDVSVSLLAGLLIITSVFAFGHFSTVPEGSGLLFTVMPSVFVAMGAVGPLVATAFYLLVAFAALSSSVSILEIPTASISDRFKMSRKKALSIILAVTLVLGTLTTLGYGPLKFDWLPQGGFLELLDYTANTFLIPIIGILTCIFVGWVLKPKAIIDEVEGSGRFRAKRIYAPIIMYVCPIILLIIMLRPLLGL